MEDIGLLKKPLEGPWGDGNSAFHAMESNGKVTGYAYTEMPDGLTRAGAHGGLLYFWDYGHRRQTETIRLVTAAIGQ